MVRFKRLLAASLALCLLAGCGAKATEGNGAGSLSGSDASGTPDTSNTLDASSASDASNTPDASVIPDAGDASDVEHVPEIPAEAMTDYTARAELEEVELSSEAVALSSSPAAVSTVLMPQASGKAVEKKTKATIDYSNIKDGYVMVQFTATTDKRLKVQVAGPTTTYSYDLPAKTWTTFPLSDGNGSYKVTVFESVGDKYAAVASVSFKVTLTDEFAPFLRPNQYVNYEPATKTIEKAAELTKNISDPLKKVETIYDFVVNNLTYDKNKAATVKTGYLPVLDDVLATKKGICFDYASLMAGMLRSQGVPCKLIVGYAGTAYHAWINVWTEETGWIDGVIFFDGTSWQRMDPTFASSGKGNESIMKYIGDGSNYTTKYMY